MEDILELYDAQYPLVCMDESCKQLVAEAHEPIAAAPGHPRLIDDEYVRKGVANIFLAVEPLGGQRHVCITERRRRCEWASFIKHLLEDNTLKRRRSSWSWTTSILIASVHSTQPSRHPKPEDWPNDWRSTTPPSMEAGSMWQRLN